MAIAAKKKLFAAGEAEYLSLELLKARRYVHFSYQDSACTITHALPASAGAFARAREHAYAHHYLNLVTRLP